LAGTANANHTILTADAVGVLVVDGVTLSLNDFVLVKDQTNQADNGLYYVLTLGNGSTAWQLHRRSDSDSSPEINPGDSVSVSEGVVNQGTGWYLVTPAPINMGTTSLVWAIFSRLGATGATGPTGPAAAGIGLLSEFVASGSSAAFFPINGYLGVDEASYVVTLDGTIQHPGATNGSYTITADSGGTITFAETPVAGALITVRVIRGQTGATGPAGGPTGATGPQGPIATTVGYLREGITIVGSGAVGTINFNVAEQPTLFYTGTSTGNVTLNLRADATTALNSVMNANESITVSFLTTNGATAFNLSAVQIDGSPQTVKWLNGAGSIPVGFTNSINAWTLTAIKTGSSIYTVIGSVSKFA
jgi:hypothetical protein